MDVSRSRVVTFLYKGDDASRALGCSLLAFVSTPPPTATWQIIVNMDKRMSAESFMGVGGGSITAESARK